MIMRREFVLANTRLQAPPHLPEIRLYLADELTPIWAMTEQEMAEVGLDPPFWAFAWAGGQAIARYLLDNGSLVRGRRVLDVGAGSAVCGIAARMAGAADVLSADIDEFCVAAIALNATVNGVRLTVTTQDLLDAEPPDVDVVLAGDVCYEHAMATRLLSWLRAARARGACVLVGDPGRRYLPGEGFWLLAEYDIPTTPEVEEKEFTRTRVLQLR